MKGQMPPPQYFFYLREFWDGEANKKNGVKVGRNGCGMYGY